MSTPAPTSQDVVRQFLGYIEMELGLSDNTLAAYRLDLQAFREFLAGFEHGDMLSATPETIGRHLKYLHEVKKLEISSILRHVAALKMFYRFAKSRQFVAADPTELLEKPHYWKRLPDVLGRKQIEALLGAVDPTSKLALRDQAILELFYACGLRASELADLHLTDLAIDVRQEKFASCRARSLHPVIVGGGVLVVIVAIQPDLP